MISRNHPTKKTICVNLIGGLGNQLFGLMFGLSISDKLGCNLLLNTSLINLGINETRKLDIDKLKITNINYSFERNWLSIVPSILKSKIARKIVTKIILSLKKTTPESKLIESLKKNQDQEYTGYFQDWIYADYIASMGYVSSVRLKDRSREKLEIFHQAKIAQPIMVHLRLGDYLKLPSVYSILSQEYYLKALSVLAETNSEVWILTEDLLEAQKIYPELISHANKIISKNDLIEDHEIFYLMCTSSKLIVSNSTFSLWAGWFALNKGAKVITPSEFKVGDVNSKLIDNRWDRIDLNSFDIIKGGDLMQIRSENCTRFDNLFK